MTGHSLLRYFTVPPTSPEAQVLEAVDLSYALDVARKVAGFGTYELGFRPAGTEAARQCARWLEQEMRRIGLPEVEVLEYLVDGWYFAGARVEPEGGPVIQAVAYGGAYGTPPDGLAGELVDCGGGTAADSRRVDVRGKIALIEMDLDRLDWPGTALLEAAHHGAIGVVCWPHRYYAMAPGALHSHDLQVSCPVPMLNVSRRDGQLLRQYRRARLFSTARPLPGATARNIIGYVPGTDLPDELVIIGDHYDAWFHGFMDDAVGVGAVLALARAVLMSGYRPRRTVAFVLHDAEEYGQADSPWDWCTGAYAQINRLRPDWAQRAVGAVIFELCGFKDAPYFDWYVSPELGPLAEEILDRLAIKRYYPLGSRLYKLVTSWEDAFSYTAAGIPSAANLELDEYVQSQYYHTQFDSEALLDQDKYGLHVAALGWMALRLDRDLLPPVDVAARARDLRRSLPEKAPGRLFDLVEQLERLGDRLRYHWASLGPEAGPALREAVGILNRGLTWLGGDGMDETMYPHEQPLRDLAALKAGNLAAVAGMSWGQHVSYPVYRRQLFPHIAKPDRCWQWAGGRVSHYVDVWHALVEEREVDSKIIREVQRAIEDAYEHEMRVLEEALQVLERIAVRPAPPRSR